MSTSDVLTFAAASALIARLDNAERAIEKVREKAAEWETYSGFMPGDYYFGHEAGIRHCGEELLAALDAALAPTTEKT